MGIVADEPVRCLEIARAAPKRKFPDTAPDLVVMVFSCFALELEGDVDAEGDGPSALYEAVGRSQVLGIHCFEIEGLVVAVQQVAAPEFQVGIFTRE